jgi:hypothetical protein
MGDFLVLNRRCRSVASYGQCVDEISAPLQQGHAVLKGHLLDITLPCEGGRRHMDGVMPIFEEPLFEVALLAAGADFCSLSVVCSWVAITPAGGSRAGLSPSASTGGHARLWQSLQCNGLFSIIPV